MFGMASINSSLDIGSLLDTFSKELRLAKQYNRPRIARKAFHEIKTQVSSIADDATTRFSDGYDHSHEQVFPQSAHPAYVVGFHVGAFEQKYSL